MPRNPKQRDAAAQLDAKLKAMFATLEGRAIPDHIRSVIDQICDEPQPAKPARGPRQAARR